MRNPRVLSLAQGPGGEATRWAIGDLEARREAAPSANGTFRSTRPASQIRS